MPHLDMTRTIHDTILGGTVVMSNGGASMKTMAASQFRAKCFQVMDQVSEGGEPVGALCGLARFLLLDPSAM